MVGRVEAAKLAKTLYFGFQTGTFFEYDNPATVEASKVVVMVVKPVAEL